MQEPSSCARLDSRGGCPHTIWSSPAVLLVLLDDVVVGHTGDVVADHAWQRFPLGLFLIAGWKGFGVLHPESEQVADDALGSVLLRLQCRAEVEILIEEVF